MRQFKYALAMNSSGLVPALACAVLAAGCASTSEADTNTSWSQSGKPVVGAPSGEGTGSVTSEWNIALSAPGEQAGVPSMQWIDGKFVVVWQRSALPASEWRLSRASIAPSGEWTATTSEPVQYSITPRLSDEGQVATSTFATFSSSTCRVVVYDEQLEAVGEVGVPCSNDAPVFPLGGGQWMVAHGVYQGGDTQQVVLERFDPSSQTLADTVVIGDANSDRSLSAFATADAASVAWPTATGSVVQRVAGFGSGSVTRSEVSVGASAYGGYGAVQIAGRSLLFGTDGASLWTADVTDPSVVPVVRDLAPTGIMDREVRTAVASELGVVGVCYGTGSGPAGGGGNDGVSFVAVNASGEVVQGPVAIETGFENIGGCAVAWSGEEFAVAYWKIHWPTQTSQLRVQRIAPAL